MIRTTAERVLKANALNSTWFYQDTTVGYLETAIMLALLNDRYFDLLDVASKLKAWDIELPNVRLKTQLEFMSLGDKTDRLLFADLVAQIKEELSAAASPAEQRAVLAGALAALAKESEPDGRIKSYADNFIYLPKVLLLAIMHEQPMDAEMERKLALSKPKLAKRLFNELLKGEI